ncbi:MAG: metal ABC transporter substrate-binding protein [Syntrophales bacterium]|nr:metal ABC transporter substrate-binding protein [Syntrophales bacterium]MDD5642844.1 metal ABC transporter substrate-binding protein [Syntrophales bacterium]
MQGKKIYAATLLAMALGFCSAAFAQTATGPLKACVTVPELGSLVREIGGNQVSVTVFAKDKENPHFVEAKPSFIKDLSQADLFVQLGLEMEMAWAPVLLQNATNGRVLPGARGFLDASTAITPLEVPTGTVDRSMGDIHPFGNPHYLADPLNGLKVAALIRDKLTDLRPGQRAYFQERYQNFRQRLGAALVGEKLARKYDFAKLAILYEHGKLLHFLKQQGDQTLLGGWMGQMLPYYGVKAVADHNLWPYFAHRFGIVVVGFMEPKPGVPLSTRHLGELIKIMEDQKVKLVLSTPFFDPRHARFVAGKTGARIVEMAHQVGARPGAGDYLSMINYNIRQLQAALRSIQHGK